MSNWRKFSITISFVLVCVMAMSMFGSLALAQSEETAELEPYDIVFYVSNDPQENMPEIEEALNEYLKDKINATVSLNYFDFGSYLDKISLIIASREKADIIYAPSWYSYSSFVSKGAFLPLDDLLDEYGQDIKENINPAFLEGPRIDGVLYAIPVNKELAQGTGLLFDKEMVDKYDFDYSALEGATFDELDELLKPFFEDIKNNETDVYPVYLAGGNGAGFSNFIINDMSKEYFPEVGGVEKDGLVYILKDDDTYTVHSVTNDPIDEQCKYYNLIRKWYLEGYINPDSLTATEGVTNEIQKTGKSAVSVILSKPGSDVEWTNLAGREYVTVDLYPPYVTTTATIGSQMAISSTSEDPARAMMFLNLLYYDPYVVNLINFGIEGVNYNKITNNVIEQIPDTGYAPQLTWLIGNQFLDYLLPNEDPQKWEKYAEFNDTAITSPVLGFSIDTTPIKTEIASISNIYSQYEALIQTGTVDPEPVVEERNEKLVDAGIEKVVAEVQSQLDAWLEATGRK